MEGHLRAILGTMTVEEIYQNRDAFASKVQEVAAEAMRKKAEAFKQYNEAAVIELIVRVLPEIAGRISEPLAKTEKMIIINSGNGPGGGASKVTGDITQIIAQLPPILESLTGVKLEKLLEQIPSLKKAMTKPTQTTEG